MPPEPPLTLYYEDEALKILSKMDDRDKKRIVGAIESFCDMGAPQPKPLSGSLKNVWKLRVDGWRIFMRFNAKEVTIVMVKRRDRAYH
jgi:mRNA-degrading endonuclease RelE of RelBE toxin-antitoxin system